MTFQLSGIFTLAVANRMPRRLMLLLSSFGISASLIVMGVYYYLKSLDKADCIGSSPVAEKLLTTGDDGDVGVGDLIGDSAVAEGQYELKPVRNHGSN